MAGLYALSGLLVLMAFLGLLLAAIFAAEVLMAGRLAMEVGTDSTGADSSASARLDEAPAPNFAVLMPAHNEEQIIGATVAAIKPLLPAGGRLLVVADNCTDATASAARSAGAEAVERRDLERRGKGFALEFGIRELEISPPDVIIVLDADCRAEPGALTLIARKGALTGRPVQALYEMHLPASEQSSNRGLRLASFAWRVKNQVRPLGLARMGLPCGLMGTGMAFPFALAQKAKLATDEIVEDLVLGLEFAREGVPPLFAPEARVSSSFPANDQGLKSQRTRWETGHLHTIHRKLPGMIATGLTQRNVALLALCADAAVPPLAFFSIFLSLILTLVGAAWLLFGLTIPLMIGLSAAALFMLSVFLAWQKAGQDLLSARDLFVIPLYVLAKVGLYARILTGKRPEWVRTRRD